MCLNLADYLVTGSEHTDGSLVKTSAMAAALRKKGYSDADVEKVMGGNFLRVMKQVIGK